MRDSETAKLFFASVENQVENCIPCQNRGVYHGIGFLTARSRRGFAVRSDSTLIDKPTVWRGAALGFYLREIISRQRRGWALDLNGLPGDRSGIPISSRLSCHVDPQHN
jgi:hypothetical protein